MDFAISPILAMSAPQIRETGTQLSTLSPGSAPGTGQFMESFGDLLVQARDSLYRLHSEADGLIQGLATGKVEDLHQVMIAIEKAGIALDFTLQLRNKALEAYQEIMRMQV